MRILFATPEVSDFVQVGGLAAVSAALPRALRGFADVRVIIPGYPAVLRGLKDLDIVGGCEPYAGLPAFEIGLGHAADGLACYVVRCAALYEREGTPYGDVRGADWHDNNIRFATFSYAAAQLARGSVDMNWTADLVHANDWQCALIPGYLEWLYARVPTVFTIHNLAYQGVFDRSSLAPLGIPEASFNIDGVEFYNRVSFIKAGLVYASHLTTVSQTYAREITTAEFGCGLEGILRLRDERHQLSGILNGVDESWDPRTCSSLSQTFGAGDWAERASNADDVREQFGLAVSRGPLFALVARLVHQKGVDLVIESAQTIVDAGGQIVVTGKGEARFEEALLQAQARAPQSIAVKLGFDDIDARRILAGSDFTLMPSRFEPCGLTQMYAQRFGSLPIGHRTGGLAETIVDGETGFLFDRVSATGFLGSLCRAFSTFGMKDRLDQMRRSAMAQPFSWSDAARAYAAIYKASV
jgi:starch synthase